MSAQPTAPAAAACTGCGDESEPLFCADCGRASWEESWDECEGQNNRDAELEDVLEFFKQAAIDVERCGRPVDLADIAARLERGEHR
jgi:hypothetical protein